MFKRPNRSKVEHLYSEEQTKHWLNWLAHRMIQESQSIFLIERMQPILLENKRLKRIYRLSFGLIYGLSVGLIFGLIIGLIGGLIEGLIGGLLVGLIGGLLEGHRRTTTGIQTVESLHLNWKKFLIIGLIFGLLIGLIFGLILGLIFGLIIGLNVGLSVGLSVGLIGGLIGGLESSEIETKISPNQGIWKSVQNAVIVGLSVGLIFGLIVGLSVGLIGGLSVGLIGGLIRGLIGGLIFGLIFGLTNGGEACIKHLSLRLILYHNGHMPWNYARFLDYATDRLFLQRVGGGYRFMHDLLRQHFAENYR
jgi:hypothetical protein